MSGPGDPRPCGTGAARLVWGGWAALSAALVWLVAHAGRNVPYWDDWKLVPVLLGGKPLTPAWLWEQGNEHRLPMARAVMWALARVSGGDLRWTMVLSALLLSALAAVVLLALRRLTGRWRWTDLALPVVLLNWGHRENVLWQADLHFVIAPALFVVAVLMLLHVADREQRLAGAPGASGAGFTAGLLLVAGPLPLQSGVGLCLSPVLVAWMLWAAGRVQDARRRRALRLCAAVTVAVATAYLADLPSSPAANTGLQGVGPTISTTFKGLAMSLGPVGRDLWPWSGLLLALLGLLTVVRLLRTVRREPERRLAASALLAGLLAATGLALSIGVSRAGLGWEAGFAPRYVTLMVPWLLCVYLAWRLPGAGAGERAVPAALCLVLCLALPFNTVEGLRQAEAHAAALDAFVADVRGGWLPQELAARYGGTLCPDGAVLAARLQLLRDRQLWMYR